MNSPQTPKVYANFRNALMVMLALIGLIIVTALLLFSDERKAESQALGVERRIDDGAASEFLTAEISRRAPEEQFASSEITAPILALPAVLVLEETTDRPIAGASIRLLPDEASLRNQLARPGAWELGATNKEGYCKLANESESLTGRRILVEKSGFLRSVFELQEQLTRAVLSRGSSVEVRTLPPLASGVDRLQVSFHPVQDHGGVQFGARERIVEFATGKLVIGSVSAVLHADGEPVTGLHAGVTYEVHAKIEKGQHSQTQIQQTFVTPPDSVLIPLGQARGVLIRCEPQDAQAGICWISRSGVRLGETAQMHEGAAWLPLGWVADGSYEISGWGPGWISCPAQSVSIPEDFYSNQNLRVIRLHTKMTRMLSIVPVGVTLGKTPNMRAWAIAGTQCEEVSHGNSSGQRAAWQLDKERLYFMNLDHQTTHLVIVNHNDYSVAVVGVKPDSMQEIARFGDTRRSTVKQWFDVAREFGLSGVVQGKSVTIEVGVRINDSTEWFRISSIAEGTTYRGSPDEWTFMRDPMLQYRMRISEAERSVVIPLEWN